MRSFSIVHYLRNKIKIQKNNQVNIGKNVGISGCQVIIKGNNNTLIIGNSARLRDIIIEIVGENCQIEIGDSCVIGHGSYLSAKENDTSLIIGKNCMFSRNVNILTSDGHPIYQNGIKLNPAKSITINDHVWLADNVTVLKGVSIGSGCVIGIHSLVTKSIYKNSVAVGIPAKIIKNQIEWEL